jgi:hypothetical protein
VHPDLSSCLADPDSDKLGDIQRWSAWQLSERQSSLPWAEAHPVTTSEHRPCLLLVSNARIGSLWNRELSDVPVVLTVWRDPLLAGHAYLAARLGEPRCGIRDVHWRIARQRVRQPGHSISQFIKPYPAKELSPPLISSLLTMQSSNLDTMRCSSTGSWTPPTGLDSLARIHNVPWLPLFALLTASRFLGLGEAGEGLALPLPREKKKPFNGSSYVNQDF